ncbi:MAG: Ni/Fe hydrogenase subunit alpha [Candidatus Electrothrix sp. MAN1_4]|nr:Ni/Fe hydrogenase subunit alpha [Candidatus Electrothrix sp. MAN1_4]
MSRTITIDPVTRIEGHARVEVDIDDQNKVTSVFKVLDFRGWETLLQGTKVEQMPSLTARICGTCSTSHHLVSAKAVDQVFSVTPPPAAVKLRNVLNLAGFLHSHSIHLFALAAPDFLLPPGTPPEQRNLLTLIDNPNTQEIAENALRLRKISTSISQEIGGRGIHPVTAVPGGMSQTLSERSREILYNNAQEGIELAKSLFDALAPALSDTNSDLLQSLPWESHYLSLVKNRYLDLYNGMLQLTSPGAAIPPVCFTGEQWKEHLKEQVTPESYAKPVFFQDAQENLVDYRVGPLARLNGCEHIDTPRAQDALDSFHEFGRPCHQTYLYHFARLIELLYAAEKLEQLLGDETICDVEVQTQVGAINGHGVGVIEAPRGVLIHDYQVDDKGLLTTANLLIATQQNISAINKTVGLAAQRLIHNPDDNALMNAIEMGIRCYDPCLSCATHRLGEMKMEVVVRQNGAVIRRSRRS